jgi:hypothetical protein
MFLFETFIGDWNTVDDVQNHTNQNEATINHITLSRTWAVLDLSLRAIYLKLIITDKVKRKFVKFSKKCTNMTCCTSCPCRRCTAKIHRVIVLSQYPCRIHNHAFQSTQSQGQRNVTYEPLAQQALIPWQGWWLCSSSGLFK